MNELVFILPAFITAFIFIYMSFKYNTENQNNIVFQIFFFIMAMGMLVLGFAQSSELAAVENATTPTFTNVLSIALGSYWAMILTMITAVLLLFVFMLYSYFKMAGDSVGSKWDRVSHKEK